MSELEGKMTDEWHGKMTDIKNQFSPSVSDKLRCYVYRLIDPRNGMTFYVGRGRGNRVFAHAAACEKPTDLEDAESLKIRLIRAIEADGFRVEHVIHRHGLDDKTAKEVEAALIDAYPGTANIQRGYATDRGVMHAQQAIRTYEAKEVIFSHSVILITINQSVEDRALIDAVRYAWRISPRRASKADYVLAVRNGLIVGVYMAEKWLPATPENFPGFPATDPGRFGFDAKQAPDEIKRMYLDRRVPPQPRGAANPIRYMSAARVQRQRADG